MCVYISTYIHNMEVMFCIASGIEMYKNNKICVGAHMHACTTIQVLKSIHNVRVCTVYTCLLTDIYAT
jgi:hypothetical protein